jgi:hypothetical protein
MPNRLPRHTRVESLVSTAETGISYVHVFSTSFLHPPLTPSRSAAVFCSIPHTRHWSAPSHSTEGPLKDRAVVCLGEILLVFPVFQVL